MSSREFAEELERVAKDIANVPRADVQILLRRAALRLRNHSSIALAPETEDTLATVASDFKISRNDLIQTIVKDWLVQNAYVPYRVLDEDTETDGTA